MNKQGFTLIELLIVIAIIGVLATLILPNIIGVGENAKKLTTKTIIKSLETPLTEYSKKHPYGKYPEASDEEEGNGTSVLIEKLRKGDYFKFKDSNLTKEEPYQLVDGWGIPMRYHPWKGTKVKEEAHNKKSYDLWSAGSDSDFSTEEDNITNWSIILDDEDNG